LQAQIHKVDPDKTVTFEVPGATAAYSLDSSLADATASNGIVSVVGISHGTTHIVVVTSSGVQTFEFLVTLLPPVYPPGFVMPESSAETGQSGYSEGRYFSSPAEIQNQFDFYKIRGDDSTHAHLVETGNLAPLQRGQSIVALSSASYEMVTPGRDITLLDKYVEESQLTINGSIVRGFHITEGNWFVHAGYTGVTTFEGLFLPIQPELVVGGGYRYALTENSSITGSFYQVRVPTSDLLGHSGSIGDVRYKYKPREGFWFTGDLGISRGIAVSGKLHYRSDRDTMQGLLRFMPVRFASLGANNLRGFHSDFSWSRRVTKKFETDATFYNNNLVLPGVKEATISGGATVRYRLTRRWALTGGATASSLETKLPLSVAIRSFTVPAGVEFQSRYFGAGGQYQYSLTPGSESGAKQFHAWMQTGWRGFSFNAQAERDTNAPTLNFIFGQFAGLQQLLEQQGIQATTIQQVDQLLSSDSYLIAAGYLKGATINLAPVRTQLGLTADWSTHGVHKSDINYRVLYNDNQLLQGSSISTTQTLTFTQSVTRSDDLSVACSVADLRSPGLSPLFSPVCLAAWRHRFTSVPYFIIPERRGSISGTVFRDDQSTGTPGPGSKPIPDVEVTLDGHRRARSRSDGTYRFTGVPQGKHKVAATYETSGSFYFTTPADAEVDEDATVDFGIGYSLSGLVGQVLNDAGQGIGGVSITIESKGLEWNAKTEADGGFFVSSLAAGDYQVRADVDSLPVGYAGEALNEPKPVTVGATSPGRVLFTARAFRSIAGRVLRYDRKAAEYVPVIGARVILRERLLNVATDSLGRYLFRDLAAGSYTISVENEPKASSRTVRLQEQPVDLKNVDFRISAPDADKVAAPPAVAEPVKPTAPALPEKQQPPPALGSDAAKHATLGRQLSSEGRYREAILELNEAIRLAPDGALSFNARGFARLRLHDWAGAIEDLNRAILLKPGYGNAYHIRSVARKAIGDQSGAADDLKRLRELGH
jgi:hypothetical protein